MALRDGVILDPGQLKSELLSEQIYGLLRKAIVAGELAPGDRIVQWDLARRLGVSQAPVREAVKRLVHEGLATHVARQGSYVTKLSEDDVTQARSVRAALERLAAMEACGRLDASIIAALEREVVGMRDAAARNDIGGFQDHDHAFHHLVVDGSRNAFLIRVWAALEPSLRNLRLIGNPRFIGDWRLMAEEHVRLLNLLRSGDTVAAAADFEAHAAGTAEVGTTSDQGDEGGTEPPVMAPEQ